MSALTDRERDERRILELENTVGSVSLIVIQMVSLSNALCFCRNWSAFGLQLERERLDLRAQVCLLKDGKEAVEEELKVRSIASEEVAQRLAEANSLRYDMLVFCVDLLCCFLL